jgi:hypothetical protein
MMLVSGGLDNRVLQWDLAGGPSVLASLDVAQVGSELSAVAYLQGWSILATGALAHRFAAHCADEVKDSSRNYQQKMSYA